MHRGAMVARVGRAGPCEAPARVARWRAPDIMSSFRSGRSSVVFPSGWGRRPRGPEGRRRLPGFAWSSRRNRWDRRHADDLTIREVCFTM